MYGTLHKFIILIKATVQISSWPSSTWRQQNSCYWTLWLMLWFHNQTNKTLFKKGKDVWWVLCKSQNSILGVNYWLLKQANLSSFIQTHSPLLSHLCSLLSLNYIAIQCSTISTWILSWKQEQMSKDKLV